MRVGSACKAGGSGGAAPPRSLRAACRKPGAGGRPCLGAPLRCALPPGCFHRGTFWSPHRGSRGAGTTTTASSSSSSASSASSSQETAQSAGPSSLEIESTSLAQAKEKLVQETATELARKVAFFAQMAPSEKDAYVARAREDLRQRLEGWPPEPERASGSERLNAISQSLEEQGSGAVVLRRSYPVGDTGETLLVLVEEVGAKRDGGGDDGGTESSSSNGNAEEQQHQQQANARSYRIRFYADTERPMQLHWGVIGTGDTTQSQWMLPPDELRPHNTICDEEACNTNLGGGGALQMTMVEISRSNPVAGITFVMKRKGDKATGEKSIWLKAPDGGNFYVPLPTDWVQAAVTERKAAMRAGYLLEKIAQGTEGTIMYHHTYNLPGRQGTMIALVKAVDASYQIEIVVDTATDQPILLHWGMATGNFLSGDGAGASVVEDTVHTDVMVNASGEWVLPPESIRPLYSECADDSCSTELLGSNVRRTIINAKPQAGITGVSFVLKVGEEYMKNEQGQDFHIPVPAGILQELSHEATKSPEVVLQRVFALGRDGTHGRVLALVSRQSSSGGGETMVEFFSDSPEPLILHWGVRRTSREGEWTLPDISIMHEPSDSEIIAGKACETQFKMAPGQMLTDLQVTSSSSSGDQSGEGEPAAAAAADDLEDEGVAAAAAGSPLADSFAYLQRACLHFKADSDVTALPFVVRTNEGSGKQTIWFKDYWGNYLLPFSETQAESGAAQQQSPNPPNVS